MVAIGRDDAEGSAPSPATGFFQFSQSPRDRTATVPHRNGITILKMRHVDSRNKQQCHSITSSTRACKRRSRRETRHLLQGRFDRLPTARHPFLEENPGEEHE
jgi:hypothetical protein